MGVLNTVRRWRSVAAEVAAQQPKNRTLTAAEWRNVLLGKGVKKEELDYLRLTSENKEKMTGEQLASYVEQNQFVPSEKYFPANPPAVSPSEEQLDEFLRDATRHVEENLANRNPQAMENLWRQRAENTYFEEGFGQENAGDRPFFDQLPAEEQSRRISLAADEWLQNRIDDLRDEFVDDWVMRNRPPKAKWAQYTGSRLADSNTAGQPGIVPNNYVELEIGAPPGLWSSGQRPYVNEAHSYGTANPVGRLRMGDRSREDGSRTLFLEELQSDLHNEAGKIGRYGPPPPNAVERMEALRAEDSDLRRQERRLQDEIIELENQFHQGVRSHYFPGSDSPMWALIDESDLNRFYENLSRTYHSEVLEPIFLQRRNIESQREALANQRANLTRSGPPPAPWEKTWPEKLLQRSVSEAIERGLDHVSILGAESQNRRWSGQGPKAMYEKWIQPTAAAFAKKYGGQLTQESVDGIPDSFTFPITEKMRAAAKKGWPVFKVAGTGVLASQALPEESEAAPTRIFHGARRPFRIADPPPPDEGPGFGLHNWGPGTYFSDHPNTARDYMSAVGEVYRPGVPNPRDVGELLAGAPPIVREVADYGLEERLSLPMAWGDLLSAEDDMFSPSQQNQMVKWVRDNLRVKGGILSGQVDPQGPLAISTERGDDLARYPAHQDRYGREGSFNYVLRDPATQLKDPKWQKVDSPLILPRSKRGVFYTGAGAGALSSMSPEDASAMSHVSSGQPRSLDPQPGKNFGTGVLSGALGLPVDLGVLAYDAVTSGRLGDWWPESPEEPIGGSVWWQRQMGGDPDRMTSLVGSILAPAPFFGKLKRVPSDK